VDLTYREYSMAHQVSAEEMGEVRDWLDKLLV
jgi:predicted esterase